MIACHDRLGETRRSRMPEHVTIRSGGAALARARLDPICTLYDEVFSQPPFLWRDDEPQLHRERLLKLLNNATFGLAIATTADDALVGFAYGFGLAADTRR